MAAFFNQYFIKTKKGLDECKGCLEGRDDCRRETEVLAFLSGPMFPNFSKYKETEELKWGIPEVINGHFIELIKTNLQVILNNLPFNNFLDSLTSDKSIKIAAERLLAYPEIIDITKKVKPKYLEAYAEIERLHKEEKKLYEIHP